MPKSRPKRSDQTLRLVVERTEPDNPQCDHWVWALVKGQHKLCFAYWPHSSEAAARRAGRRFIRTYFKDPKEIA